MSEINELWNAVVRRTTPSVKQAAAREATTTGLDKLWSSAKASYALQKEAASPAELGVKLLSWGGGKLKGLGGAAKATKSRAVFDSLGGRASSMTMGKADRAAMKSLGDEAAAAVGNRRMTAGKALNSAAAKVTDSQGVQSAINYGTAGAGVLGAGAVGNAIGTSSGQREGLEQGAAQGFDAGLQAGAQQSSVDPGVLGRMLEVFTGRQPSFVDGSDPEMAFLRRQAMQRILSGNVKTASAKKLLAAAGVGAAGGGMLGHTVGRKAGFRDGAGQGYDAGVVAPPAGPSVDPGMVQRLLEVFTGRRDTAQSLRDLNVERVVRGELVNGKPVTP